MLGQFDHIVGVATNVIQEFNEIYHLEHITEVIPVVMDTERILKMAKMKPIYQTEKKNLNIILIGRCHPVKGYDRLFQVIHRLKDETLLEKIRFSIFGDGPLFEALKERLWDDNLDCVISMYGAVSNPYAELKNYDLLLLPSFSEAFGTVISEAHILDVPVLATKTSASLMSIHEGIDGWICENSEEGLYQSLKMLISDPKQIEVCRRKLKGFHYDNENLLKRIEMVLDEKR